MNLAAEAVEKSTTATSSTLRFSLKIPSGRFNHIYVVALKIIKGKQPKSPGSYRNNELVTYSEVEKSTEPRPYVASVFSASDLESDIFVLGDGKNTTYSKGRNLRSLTSEFYNAPLEGGSTYSIFQRVFVDDKGDYYSTEWSPASRTNYYQGHPEVLTNISSVDVMAKIGNHVNLLCAAEGEPPISFRWEKAKSPIKSILETDKPYHSSLVVLKMRDLSSFGEYTCHVRDRFSTVSHTIQIWNIVNVKL
ncbi:Receptor-type tyrosine- phosphatase delta [Paramuricea clavata]|uniref:Receptor-type tyrosine- phosphatase delta n=1 Tax=Paramuricea clavata TaxID=317549 RepID=A0A7D9IWC3_PARCT|nr:Receptor-type tyrosine- phosphatase delta [Paramuricea clavata]